MLRAPRLLAPGVDALATRALSALATRSDHGASELRDDLVEALRTGIQSFDCDVLDNTLGEFHEQKISSETIIDTYIPAVARLIGEAWCLDQMSFAEVTIGSARLQAIVRDLAPNISADTVNPLNTASVVIVVRDGEHHTLGAVIAANQLRRNGISVQLMIGAGDTEIVRTIAAKDFDVVAISASSGETVSTVSALIRSLRATFDKEIPIALGGSIVGMVDDLQARTGADIVTNETSEILQLCGLATQPMHAALPDVRG